MGRKPNPKPDDPAQSKRFIDMAREVQADGDKESFGRAFKEIARPLRIRPTGAKEPS